jgi:hypothetical protein
VPAGSGRNCVNVFTPELKVAPLNWTWPPLLLLQTATAYIPAGTVTLKWSS